MKNVAIRHTTEKKTITWDCKNVDNKDNFLLYKNISGCMRPFQIDLNSDLGMLARIAYAEAENEPLWVRIGICEIARNRILSNEPYPEKYCGWVGFPKIKNYKDSIEKGFKGVNEPKYKDPIAYLKLNDKTKNYAARKQFVLSIAAALFMLNFNSNIVKGALFNVANCKYNCYQNCPTLPRYIPAGLPKAITCFYTKIENLQK